MVEFPDNEPDSAVRPLVEFVGAKHEYVKLPDEYRMEFGFPLERPWEITKDSEAYDRQDKVFALLGLLARRSFKIAHKINYDICPCVVSSDMIMYMRLTENTDDMPMVVTKEGLWMPTTLKTMGTFGDHTRSPNIATEKITVGA